MFKRLLLVEDETFALEDLRDALLRISPSLEIVTARSGSQALELLRNEKFDALFLDIELPGIGGLDVMRELGAAAPPTVLVTGHLREAIEAFGLGVVECILKPVDDAK
ncbi:MAG: response regulator, partial [Terrimicrobiaceae bacterium]|nr:response regulator [Terrimicrobiaceae bacterium]